MIAIIPTDGAGAMEVRVEGRGDEKTNLVKEYGFMVLNLESERLVIADKDGTCFME